MNKTDVQARSWWHLHRSTLFLLLLFLVPYALVAIPLTRMADRFGEARFHGWPTVHLAQYNKSQPHVDAKDKILRLLGGVSEGQTVNASSFYWTVQMPDNSGLLPRKVRHWSDMENWRITKSADESIWYVRGLLANVGCLAIYACFISTALEWLRRRKSKWYQVTLMDCALLVVLISAALSSGIAGLTKSNDVKRAITALHETDIKWSMSIKVDSPVWFERLTDGNFLPEQRFFSLRSRNTVSSFGGASSFKSDNNSVPLMDLTPDQLPLFSSVHRLNFSEIGNNSQTAINIFNSCSPESLSISASEKEGFVEFGGEINAEQVKGLDLRVTNTDFPHLNRFKNLRTLDLMIDDCKPVLSRLPVDYLHLRLFGIADEQRISEWLSELDGLRDLSLDCTSSQANLLLSNLNNQVESLKLIVRFNPNNGPAELDCSGLYRLINLKDLAIIMELEGAMFGGNEEESFKDFELTLPDLSRLELNGLFIGFPNIDELVQPSNNVADHLPSAKTIVLRNVKLNKKMVDRLTSMESLRTFNYNPKNQFPRFEKRIEELSPKVNINPR